MLGWLARIQGFTDAVRLDDRVGPDDMRRADIVAADGLRALVIHVGRALHRLVRRRTHRLAVDDLTLQGGGLQFELTGVIIDDPLTRRDSAREPPARSSNTISHDVDPAPTSTACFTDSPGAVKGSNIAYSATLSATSPSIAMPSIRCTRTSARTGCKHTTTKLPRAKGLFRKAG